MMAKTGAEHLGDVARVLFPEVKERRKIWVAPIKKILWEGKIPSLLSELGALRVRGKKIRLNQSSDCLFREESKADALR